MKYGAEDGLANKTVLSVIIDNAGVKWFGTSNGVSRYDGDTWRTMGIADGLPDSTVNAIAQDGYRAISGLARITASLVMMVG